MLDEIHIREIETIRSWEETFEAASLETNLIRRLFATSPFRP